MKYLKVYMWATLLFYLVKSSSLILDPEETPIGYLGVELEGWKLCSPENVCIDVLKVEDGADGDYGDSCNDNSDDCKDSGELGSVGRLKNHGCKAGSKTGAGFFFPMLNERKQEQEAYRAFLMNTIWGTFVIFRQFCFVSSILYPQITTQ